MPQDVESVLHSLIVRLAGASLRVGEKVRMENCWYCVPGWSNKVAVRLFSIKK